MQRPYAYVIKGTAAHDQTWESSGVVTCEFVEVFNEAMKASFQALTNGEATYGKPGLTCTGPFHITSFLVTQKNN